MKKMIGISKFNLFLALLVFCMIAGPACAAELLGNDNIGIDVGNDDGTYLVPGTTYQLNLEADMADLHIASDPANSAGDITQVNTTSGTFYITCTNESRVFDDTVLMLAVNGTIPDNFTVAVTSSGYRWEGPAEKSKLPEYGNLTYASSALSETFANADLSYGPQIWKPANAADTPIFTGQNMSDTEDTFSLVFIDLKTGALCNATNLTSIDDLTDRGAVKIEYTFENLQSFAVFNAYGLTNTTSAEIVTTNDVSGSLYSVLIEEEEAEPVMDNITVSPSTATLEIDATANFTATAYDAGGSEMSGITFNWSVSDETIGNVTSEGVFTGLSAGTVNVTASSGNVSGYAVVTISEVVGPTPTPTPATETYGGVIPAVNNVYLRVANDGGAYFNDWGNHTSRIKWVGGGLNSLHITDDSRGSDGLFVNYGQITETNDLSGTFYVSTTGGRGYQDDILLLVAVNGTVPDDFRLHITTNGYQWTPNSTPNVPPAPQDITYAASALDEWFTKDDLIYGPQTWRPAAGTEYQIFPDQDVTDTSNKFYMMLIDLNAGVLTEETLEVNYEIENMNSLMAFCVYGYAKNLLSGSTVYHNSTQWTNAVGTSGWYVSGAPLPDAASVVIDLVSAEVPVNGKQQFTATAYDSDSNEINGALITWTSSVTGVGTIDSDGLFTPVSEGATIITATSGSVSQTASVTVTAAVEKVLTTSTLDPDSVLMYNDQIGNLTFTATGYDQFGDEISAVYTWSSTVPVVGSIDGTGFFTGKAEGTTVVSATSGSVSQTATVVIKEHPDWDVTLIGTINRTLNRSDILDLASSGTMSYTDNKGYLWEGVSLTSVLALFDDHDPSTFNTTLANLDYNVKIKGQASGNNKTVLITSLELIDTDKSFITAHILDGYEIPETPVSGRIYWPLKLTGSAIANYGRNIEEITNITIEFPLDVRRIGITSDSVITFVAGSTIQFAATAYDSADVVIEHIPFTWSVSDSSIGTIDADGLFTPIKAGTVNVTATYKLVSESVTVTVLDDSGAITWTVDQGGNGDFTTIQGAIDYARDGDTIIVHDGVYSEKLTIDKGLTFLSQNGYEATVIEDSNREEYAVTITGDNVRITGFNISGYKDASLSSEGAMKIIGSENCVLSGNLFPTRKSIITNSVDNLRIENNYFAGMSPVDLTGATNSVFFNNEMTSTSEFSIHGGSNITISNNNITGTGIKLDYSCDNITISDNIFEGPGTGVFAESGSDIRSMKILDNDFVNPVSRGINFEGSGENVEIAGNSITNPGVYGISFSAGPFDNFSIHNNKIMGGTTATLEFEMINSFSSLNLYMNDVYTHSPSMYGIIDFWEAPEISLNSTSPVTYVYNGETYTGFVGNWYDSYGGTDTDGDGLGETPFNVYANHYHSLVSKIADYLVLEAKSINLTPASATIEVGESTNFTGRVLDQRCIDFPGAVAVYSSGSPSVGTINISTGHFVALHPGTTTITASYEDLRATADVTVVKMTKKKVTTNFTFGSCCFTDDGNGGSLVSVSACDATIQDDSIFMQGNGFNLTVRTTGTPVISGGRISETVSGIVLNTTPVSVDLQHPGNVSAGFSLNLNSVPEGAGVTTTVTQNIDNESQSAFQLAANSAGLKLNAVAYTMNVAKRNLTNGNDIIDATIRMSVISEWVVAHGGRDSIKILRFGEDGTKEVLNATFIGTDGDMDVFEAFSPNGLSIFGLVSTAVIPQTTPVSTDPRSYSVASAAGSHSSVASDYVENIGAGEAVSLVFDETAISKIDVKATADILKLMLTVEEIEKPSVIDDVPEEVYQYVKVVSYYAPEESISMATLHFDVPKEWLGSINSDPSTVCVYRYDEEDEDWVLLSTVSEGGDIYAYNFFADTSEFGIFAIVAKGNTATSEDASNPAGSSSEQGAQQSSGSQSTGDDGQDIPLPYLVLATGMIIGIPVAGYGWLKRRQK